MTPEKIVENHKKYILQSWSKQASINPIAVARAEGIYFYDYDGNGYIEIKCPECKKISRIKLSFRLRRLQRSGRFGF